MSKIVKIYCEGKRGSHDFDIIEKVISDLSVSIQPIGSKKGAGSAIQVYEQLAEKSDTFILFRDRDFDVEVPPTPVLTIDRYTHFSYRTTIENYLFDRDIFYEFILKNRLEKTYNIHNIADVQRVFTESARKIAYYQALRHTMGKMRIPTDFGTTWIEEGSGTLPPLLELEDNPSCRRKALAKVNVAKNQTNEWTEAAFDTLLDSFYTHFNTANFYEDSIFLIWFQGKDFAKAISLILAEFPMKAYYKFAKSRFDYTKFADLVQLRGIIQSHLHPIE